MASHIVGYPRMGPKRELKFALESFWDGKSSAEDLQKVSADRRSYIWKQMADAGIKHIPSNTFSYYDQVLDTTALLGAVQPRYGWNGGEIGFDTYFSMARGNASVPAMEMTNYHFIVPELGPDVNFSYASHKAVDEYKEAKADGSYFDGLLYALRGVKQHMHKVPEKFRRGNEEFYRSRVVTIGPCHDFDAHFLRCAGIKLQYIEAFAARYSCGEDHLKELGRRLGESARGYYSFKFEQIPSDFETMMVVDGIFLLELMLRSRFPEYRKAGDDDPIFNSTRIIVDVCRDILLIENQLPFIGLEELYQQLVVPHPRPEHVSLPQLARHFFNAHLFGNNIIPPTPTDGDEFQFDQHSMHNLVTFARSFLSPRLKSSRLSSASDGDNYRRDTTITVQLIPPSVSKLYEAGVKLEKLSSAISGLNIGFDKGRLKIPHLDYWTGSFFLNVMVFEENDPSGGQDVSQFMFFMGWMIRTSKDVDILIESGIISSKEGVPNFFEKWGSLPLKGLLYIFTYVSIYIFATISIDTAHSRQEYNR